MSPIESSNDSDIGLDGENTQLPDRPLSEQIRTGLLSVNLNPRHFLEQGMNHEMMKIMGVEAHPKLLQNRGESGHNVSAYVLQMYDRQTGETTEVPCILKPHRKSIKAEQEYKNILKVAQRGIKTPPALALMKGDKSYVAVAYDENLRAADTIQWRFLPEGQREEEQHAFMQLYAQALAELHVNGVYHHDPQPRNVNYDRAEGSVNFFDFEVAHVVDGNRHRQARIHVPHATKDLERVLWGCCREGLIDPQQDREEALAEYEREFLGEYFRALSNVDQKLGSMSEEVKKGVDENFQMPVIH